MQPFGKPLFEFFVNARIFSFSRPVRAYYNRASLALREALLRYQAAFLYCKTKVMVTGSWSEWAKPVSTTVLSVTETLSVTMKPSTVRTYCPA